MKNEITKTYRDVLAANDGKALEFSAKFGGEWLYDAADSTLVQKGA